MGALHGPLRGCARPDDLVARLGGDEFALLLPGLVDPRDALDLAQQVQARLAHPMQIGNHEVRTHTRIGVAVGTPGAGAGEQLLREADVAMYEAKQGHLGRVTLFDARIAQALERSRADRLGTAVVREHGWPDPGDATDDRACWSAS